MIENGVKILVQVFELADQSPLQMQIQARLLRNRYRNIHWIRLFWNSLSQISFNRPYPRPICGSSCLRLWKEYGISRRSLCLVVAFFILYLWFHKQMADITGQRIQYISHCNKWFHKRHQCFFGSQKDSLSFKEKESGCATRKSALEIQHIGRGRIQKRV